MTTTRNTKRTRTAKLAARTAAATLSLLGLTALAGPAGANVVDDQTPPEYNATFSSQANGDGWHQEAVTIEWNWFDDESGIGTECDHSSTTTNEGRNFVVASCTNGSGLTAHPELLLQVDTVPPEVTIDPVADGGATLHFSATDETSGVDHFICSLGDDAPTERCESPIDLSALPTGYNDIAIQAVDRASNISERAYFTHVVFPDLPSGSTTAEGIRIVKKRNGDVTIIGTQGDDKVFLRRWTEPGHIAIGLGSDSFDKLVWAGPVRNISISAKNGDDVLQMNDVGLPGNLTVDLGQDGGDVNLQNSTVDGRVSLRVGSNRSETRRTVQLDNSVLRGSVTLIGGRSDDRFNSNRSTIAGRLSIRAGSGNNWVSLYQVDGVTRFDYRGGQGQDDFSATNTALGSRSAINTDGGDDRIRVIGRLDGLTINSGGGNDQIELGDDAPDGSGETGDVVRVIAGSGDDVVLVPVGLGEVSLFDGGRGSDQYFGPESYSLRNFEAISPNN